MILTRKLLTPTLLLFTILLAGLFTYFFSNLHDVYHEAEEGDLASFSDAFSAELENQKQIAVVLATEVAGDPNIQELFARRDRQGLANVISPGLGRVKEAGGNIVIYQFHLPDGKLFFDILDPERPASTETSSSPIILLATQKQMAVAGLESEKGELGIRGVVPVFHDNVFVGSLEIGLGLNKNLLETLKEKYGGEWHILILNEAMPGVNSDAMSPDPQFTVFASTQPTPLFNDPESYQAAIKGKSTITHPSVNRRDYALLSEPIQDYSGRIIGVLDIVYDHTHISAVQNSRLILAGLISLFALIIGVVILTIATRNTLQPIQSLTLAAAAVAEGRVASDISIAHKDDEIGILVRAFNRMTSELRGSIVDLEQRVADRTRDLEYQSLRLRVAAEIARDALSASDLVGLLDKAVQLIHDRFNLYHVGIFIIDKNGEFATLTSSPTAEGKTRIAENLKIPVGDPNPIGRVARSGEPQTSLEIKHASGNFPPHLLPGTQSEIAIPLKADLNVLGVLDIQSDKPRAFNQNDVAIMQILADQLATAIEKTRLAQEVALTLNELERSYGRYTREGWQNLARSGRIKNRGYRFDNIRIEPAKIPEISQNEVRADGSQAGTNNSAPSLEVALPIKLRGQTIGTVHAKLREGSGDASVATLQQAIDRLATALESARLYEQASYRADREQAISQITNAIGSSSDYETIMRTTVRELGNILGDTDVAVRIIDDNGNGAS